MQYAEPRDHIALFCEMRLGKTVVAIRWAQKHLVPTLGGVLVVAPLTVLAGWENELHEEGEDDIVWLNRLSDAQRFQTSVNEAHRWYLMNYESLWRWKQAAHVPWSVVICDESTRIRNAQAKITKFVNQKLSDVPHRAILSGLPNPESPMDYFEQMRFEEGDRWMGFGNFWTFREALFMQIGYDWIPRRGTNGKSGTIAKIKEAVHRDAFVLTRKQAGIGSIKVYEKRVIAANAIQKRAFKEIRKKFSFTGVQTIETKSAGAQFIWEHRVAGGFSPDRENPQWIADGKLQEIRALLNGELKGEQVVIWFFFNEELAAVYRALQADGFTAVAILGDTPVKPVDKRELRRRQFQSGKAQICCMQSKVGRYGLDLSASDTAIYYSNTWEYEARAQSEDRIVHPKKTDPLLYVDLVTEDSTDEDAVDTLRDKSVTASTFTSKFLSRMRARYEQGSKSRAA